MKKYVSIFVIIMISVVISFGFAVDNDLGECGCLGIKFSGIDSRNFSSVSSLDGIEYFESLSNLRHIVLTSAALGQKSKFVLDFTDRRSVIYLRYDSYDMDDGFDIYYFNDSDGEIRMRVIYNPFTKIYSIDYQSSSFSIIHKIIN